MSEASFASLGPTLLARKGGAKPAMRPQLAPLPELVAEEQLEDLGWNDMGHDEDAGEQPGADVVAIDQAAAREAANEDSEFGNDSPLVQRQQRRLAQRILSDTIMESAAPSAKSPGAEADAIERAPVQPKPVAKTKRSAAKKSASRANRRAAFTLRLDTDRHLKLRLAATMQGVSAQSLVTEALDAMLSEIEDLDALAQRMNSHLKHT